MIIIFRNNGNNIHHNNDNNSNNSSNNNNSNSNGNNSNNSNIKNNGENDNKRLSATIQRERINLNFSIVENEIFPSLLLKFEFLAIFSEDKNFINLQMKNCEYSIKNFKVISENWKMV